MARNSNATGGLVTLVALATIGTAGVVAVKQGAFGPALQQRFTQLFQSPGQAPAGGSNQPDPSAGWTLLNLLDWGGFQVEYRSGSVRQVARLGGTNVYRQWDVFRWPDGSGRIQWAGGTLFVDLDTGAPVSVGL